MEPTKFVIGNEAWLADGVAAVVKQYEKAEERDSLIARRKVVLEQVAKKKGPDVSLDAKKLYEFAQRITNEVEDGGLRIGLWLPEKYMNEDGHIPIIVTGDSKDAYVMFMPLNPIYNFALERVWDEHPEFLPQIQDEASEEAKNQDTRKVEMYRCHDDHTWDTVVYEVLTWAGQTYEQLKEEAINTALENSGPTVMFVDIYNILEIE